MLGQCRDAADPDARIRCYRQALEVDPEYAQARVGLGDEWVRQSLEGSGAPRQVMESARGAIREALAIDDSLPEAHSLLATVKWAYEWDWPGARREFERALDLNPNSAATRTQYARYLALLGRRQEALTQLENIRVLDPVSAELRGIEASVYFLIGDYDHTIRHARSVLAGDPGLWLMYFWMGRAYDTTGQLPEAIAALEKWHNIPGRMQGRGFGSLGAAYARAGRREDAMRLLDDALTRSRHAYVSPTSIGQIYAALGDRRHAMEWLEKGYEERDHSLVTLKTDPIYNPLRREDRFVALQRKMNLE